MTSNRRPPNHGNYHRITAETGLGPREFDAFAPAPLQGLNFDYDVDFSREYQELADELAGLAAAFQVARGRPGNIADIREAVASCAIENIHAAAHQVLLQPMLPTNPDLVTQQAMACLASTQDLVANGITERAINMAHRVLLFQDPDFAEHTAGVYRDTAVFIVSGGRVIHCMAPVATLPEAMQRLVEWVNSPQARAYPLDIRIALAHYQFETIHPYPDGNGRIGRSLNAAIYRRAKPEYAATPFSPSVNIDADRSDYYRALNQARNHADWPTLFEFITTALCNDAHQNIHAYRTLTAAREAWRQDAALRDEHHDAIELALTNPFISMAYLRRTLNLNAHRARRIFSDLTQAGVLERHQYNGRAIIYQCPTVLDAYHIRSP